MFTVTGLHLLSRTALLSKVRKKHFIHLMRCCHLQSRTHTGSQFVLEALLGKVTPPCHLRLLALLIMSGCWLGCCNVPVLKLSFTPSPGSFCMERPHTHTRSPMCACVCVCAYSLLKRQLMSTPASSMWPRARV